MRRPDVPSELRAAVAADAGHRCGYCRTPQQLVNVRLELEHIRPWARGGQTERRNLWLCCPTCNRFKGDRVSGADPASGRRVQLFNPRRQPWDRHFRWAGVQIEGLTPTGRATVLALRLNHPLHLSVRRLWVRLELFP